MNNPVSLQISPAERAELSEIEALLERVGLPLDGFAASLPNTITARVGGQIIGCSALEDHHPYALLRSVAVAPEYQKSGFGQRLVKEMLRIAQEKGIEVVYLLTETGVDYFPKFGFQAIARSLVPNNVKTSVEFTHACPESAVAMRLVLNEYPSEA